MNTDQKLTALVRVLRLVFQYVGTFLPSNVQDEIRRTLDAVSSSDSQRGGSQK